MADRLTCSLRAERTGQRIDDEGVHGRCIAYFCNSRRHASASEQHGCHSDAVNLSTCSHVSSSCWVTFVHPLREWGKHTDG
jgi:hypothetical protein